MNLHKKKLLFLAIFVSFIFFSVYAQQENYSDDALYVIDSWVFVTDGITRDYALNNRLNLYNGEILKGMAALANFISEKTQLLLNERIFESARIEYTTGQALPFDSEEAYPVDLVIYTKDSWNIIALPYPKYDDNSGFSISIKARDYNFLGAMSPLKLDLGYQYDIEGKSTFSFLLDSNIPFPLFGLIWEIDFDNEFMYRMSAEKPFFYGNTTGLSVELPLKRTIFTIGFSESFFLDKENPQEYQDRYGRFQEGLYFSSKPYINIYIPTGLKIESMGELVYSQELYAVFNHELPQWPLNDFRKGPLLGFTHSLDFGRVDWIGNFRKGFYASIGSALSYNFYSKENNIQPLGANMKASAESHFILSDFSGISFRLMYRQWFFNEFYRYAGDVLRGFLDKLIFANYMISLNLDFPLRVLQFRPSQWRQDNSFSSVFDFDLHLIPIIDAAFFSSPQTDSYNKAENVHITCGLELVFFPLRWRSLFLRASIGFGMQLFNPKAPVTNEIFIGMELYY